MTGIFFRVLRDGKWQSIELEHMTKEERADLLKGRGEDAILTCLTAACDMLTQSEKLFDQLVEEGILIKE